MNVWGWKPDTVQAYLVLLCFTDTAFFFFFFHKLKVCVNLALSDDGEHFLVIFLY